MQTFGKFVESCLRQAEKEGISSIAFPSIGTGRLGYSVKDVARTMFQTVHKFAAERNDGCLKEVAFIMYHKDHKSLQVNKPINTPMYFHFRWTKGIPFHAKFNENSIYIPL